MLPKEEYTIIEAAIALGKSSEYVRATLAQKDPELNKNKRVVRKVTHEELVNMALPGMTYGAEPPRLVDGVNYYTKEELLTYIGEL